MKFGWIACLGLALVAWSANAQTAPAPQTPSSQTGTAATSAAKTQKAGATSTSPATRTGKAPAKAPAPLALTTDKDKLSYAVGLAFAKSLKAQGIDVDSRIVDKGLLDGISGDKALMTDEQLKTTMLALQQEVQQRRAEETKQAGDAFRAENAKMPGVVTLPSGLQYKIITPGDGPKPTEDSTVMCNYRGTFIDGREFDSSHDKPVPFSLKGIIPGMAEALRLMSAGAKWQLVIPPNLAYGERGAGNVIAPNTTLVFEVELVSIQNKPAAPPTAPQLQQ